MTSRIADAAASSDLINIMMRARNRLGEANRQVVSGKVSDKYQGISRSSQRLVNLETSFDINERYISNNNLADLRLSVMDSSIEGIRDSIVDMRLNITNFNGSGQFDKVSVSELQVNAFNNLKSIQAFLNTEVNGQFVFAGSETRTAPVDLGLTTLGAFQNKYDGAINSYPTTRDMHLSTISLSGDTGNDDTANITSTNWLTFRQDDDGVSSTGGTSSIEARGALFTDYTVGSRLTISGTSNNNGDYTIKSISADKTKIFVETEMLTSEELPGGLNTQAGVATATFTLPDGSQILNGATGNIAFNRDAGTITATTPTSLDTINVGDIIQIGGAGGNNGTFKVAANTGTTLTVTSAATITMGDGSVIDSSDTARIVFNRSNDTITADNAAFSNLTAGDIITVAGTAENNASYTVNTVSADGKSITIKGSKLTDEGTTSGNNYFDFKVGSQYVFATVDNSVVAQDITGAVIPGAFSDLQVGDSVVVANANVANNATYTVATVSSDGSKLTFTNTTTVGLDETDKDGVTLTSALRGLTFHSGDEIVFNAAAKSITLQDITSSGATPNSIFGDLKVGMTINITGTASNNGTFTIATLSGSSITVSENLTDETFDPDVTGTAVDIAVYAASGTLGANNSYYQGDDLVLKHRVDESRTIDWDLSAIHPSFEKAIRALSIIAQGDFGSEGGLDQNRSRVENTMYLLNDALDKTTAGTPPYGAEIKLDMREIEFTHGFKQIIINDTRTLLENDNALIGNFIGEIENVDQLTAITALIDEQRGLEASYQAMSKLLQLSLVDFL